MSRRQPEFLPSPVKPTDRGFCRKQTATTWPNERCSGVEGERGPRRDRPLHFGEQPRESLGDPACHRGRRSGWRVARARPDIQVAPPPTLRSQEPRGGPEMPPPAAGATAALPQSSPRQPRAVTGPPAATTLTLRRLGSRARPPQPPGRLPRPQRRKQPPALLAALLSCSHLCARAPPPLPPPPPEAGLALPRPPSVCRCGAVAGADAAAGGGACGRRGGRGAEVGRRLLAPSPRGAAAWGVDAGARRPLRKPSERQAAVQGNASVPRLHSDDGDGVPGTAGHP